MLMLSLNSLRLLKLDDRVKQMVIDEQLTAGHARALLAVKNPEQQIKLAYEAVSKGMSVREVEELVKKPEKKTEKKPEKKAERRPEKKGEKKEPKASGQQPQPNAEHKAENAAAESGEAAKRRRRPHHRGGRRRHKTGGEGSAPKAE